MPRSTFALVAALAVLVFPVAKATAGSVPSGTISCLVYAPGDTYMRISPQISSTPSSRRLLAKADMEGVCDNSGVTGGKAPITVLKATLVGKLAVGTTCASLTSAPQFDRLKLKVKWRTTDAEGRNTTVATSTVHFVDATWDDAAEALVFTSQPLKGAFAGSTATVTLTIDGVEFLGDNCGPYLGVGYGHDFESKITIP